MKTFKYRKFHRLLLLSVALLFAAGIGLVLSFRSFLETMAPKPPLEDLHNASRVLLSSLSLAALLALGVVVFAATALLRREVLRRRRSDLALRRFRQAADASSDLITVLATTGRIEYVNAAVERVTGFAAGELVGRRRAPCLPWYADADLARRMRKAVLEGTEFAGRIDGRTRDGATLILEEFVAPFRNEYGRVNRLISTARDVTREHGLEDHIDFLKWYDPLTGLYNRRGLLGPLEDVVASAKEKGATVSVLVLGIDRFKHVNDLYGADIGDEVLRQAAARIRSSIAPSDILARTGNDEFTVVHADERAPALGGAIAQQLRTSFSRPVTASGQELALTVSIGIATLPADGEDAWSLQKNADLALSRAKAQGRNAIQFFDREIADRVKEFFILEKSLFTALGNNEYILHYQPYCDLQTRAVAGAEALIRWKNPHFGVVSPAKFIPSLEDTGKVIEVGRWILRTACGRIKEWEHKLRPVPVSVNLSLAQFRHQHLVGMVRETIDEFKLDPKRLTLEVTETVFMHDMDLAIKTLHRLKDEGVMLSVDDFGTGYSSLSYIKKLPIDNLKIDISFVRDVTRDQDAASIIAAITTLAKSLNLKTIAEGVETEEQRNILHLLRCDMGQGYLFSPAVDAKEFDALL